MRVYLVLHLIDLLNVITFNHDLKLSNISVLRKFEQVLIHFFNVVYLFLIFRESLFEFLDQLRL